MFRSRSGLAVLTLALVTADRPAAGRDSGFDLRRIRVRSDEDAAAVAIALLGAQSKLRRSACQQLLDEYRDSGGRRLRDNLETMGMEAPDYLTLLVVADGGERGQGARCRTRGVAAVTTPNGRVVYLCGPAFRELSRAHRENALIHEMLHTLGLGENPPSPQEINAAVWSRCHAAG